MKFELLILQTLFCPVFKWSDHVIRQTILKPDIFDHITDIFCPFSDHLTTRPFDNWTRVDNLNTRLVQYSAYNCTIQILDTKKSELSSVQLVTVLFKYWTLKSLNFRCFRILSFCFPPYFSLEAGFTRRHFSAFTCAHNSGTRQKTRQKTLSCKPRLRAKTGANPIMECYVTHLSLWRAAIYCGTLWVPLPPIFPPNLV